MEIEFVEHPLEPLPAQWVPEPPPRRRFQVARFAAAPVFLAAAVLAVVAPFQRFYVISVKSGGFGQSESFDGWGRLTALRSDVMVTSVGEHTARYGVVLMVLAGLSLAVAAGCAAAAVRRLRPAVRAATAVSGAVVAGSLGVSLAMAWLDAAAVIDSTRQLVSPGVGRTLADRFAFSSGYGAFLWLLVAATGCAVAGTVAAVRLALAEPAPTGGAAPEPSRPVPAEPGEELHW